MSPVQDALFFLKDFFSNLASYVNPYLPVDPATEGELFHMFCYFFSAAYLINCLQTRQAVPCMLLLFANLLFVEFNIYTPHFITVE